MNDKQNSILIENLYLQTVVSLFEEQTLLHSDKPALVSGDVIFTYRELNNRANRLAAVLKNIGIGKENMVAVIARRSPELIIGICAVLKAGGAYVPIDPDYPEKRIQFILEDCKAAALLSADSLYVSSEEIPALDIMGESAGTGAQKNPEKINTSKDLAYIMYTSGTSGEPKGCMIEHRSIVRLVKNPNYITLDSHTKILPTGAPAFDASTFEIWGSLLNGGTLYFVDKEVLTDTDMLGKAIRKYGINILWLTTALFNYAVGKKAEIFESLTYLLTGSEVISEAHVRRFREVNKKTKLIHCYGPTENTTFTTTYEIPEQFDKIPIGKAISGTEVYIMNGQNLCGQGEEGEICTAGYGLSRGYLNRRELTEEKFIPNRMGEGKLYRTGDMGKVLPDGNILFLGRKDSQVKISGYRIEPEEIKNVFCRKEGIVDAVVTAKRPHNKELVLCAYYMAEKEIGIEKIRAWLSEELPDYMIPVSIMKVEKIPMTPGGKVDLKALPDIAEQEEGYLAPTGLTEKKLTAIFEELLNRTHIGIKDNFFYLGGQSITAALAVSGINEEFGIKLPLRDIFLNPSVERLAKILEFRMKQVRDKKENTPSYAEQESPTQGADEENKILLHIADMRKVYQNIISSWKSRKLLTLSPIQEISFQSGIKVSGMQMDFNEPVDINKLERVWIKIVGEYDVLRSFICISETKRGMEVFEAEEGMFLPYVDLTVYEEDIKKKVIMQIEGFRDRYYDNQMYAGDTLTYGVLLVKLKGDCFRLYFDCTHLIFDGYSADLLEGRIRELYYSSEDALRENGKKHTYETYTNKIAASVPAVSEEELIKELKLDKFVESLHEYKNFTEKEELDCFCYTYYWNELEKIKEDEIVRMVENAYDKAMRYAFPDIRVPFFVIINGREYAAYQFFDDLGELIDCMPFVFDGSEEENVFRGMSGQLERMKKYNINYVGLMISENLQKNFPVITQVLMTIGMLQVNIPIFNYLIMYQNISPDRDENIPQMNGNTAMNVSSICYTKNHVDMYILSPKKKTGEIKEMLDKLFYV